MPYSDSELQHRRKLNLDGLVRANTVGLVIVLLVVALAVAAIVLARRSEGHARVAAAEQACPGRSPKPD